MDNDVYALAVSGTDLYAGGYFTTAGDKWSPFFARANLPYSVTTQNVSNIDSTSATGNGTAVLANCLEHGHVWSTSQNPTVAGSKTELGVRSSAGAFTSPITGLAVGTTYYVRAYVTTSVGTAYGTEVSFTTLKREQTITFAQPAAKTYGDAAFTLSATASSGLAVSYASSNTAVATVSSNTVTITGAGTATITASQAGNAEYNAAPNVERVLTVNPKSVTITGVTAANKTYDGTSAATLSGSAVSGKVGTDDVTVVAGTGAFASANAGTQAVTATGYSLGGAKAANYTLSAQPTVANATITPKALTITAENKEKNEGESDPAFTVTYSGFITGETSSVLSGLAVSRAAGETAGTYAITPSGATASNYTITFVSGTLTFHASTAVIDRGESEQWNRKSAAAGVLAGPNPVSVNDGEVQIQVCAGGPATIQISIFTQLGVLVDKLEGSVQSADGVRLFAWDLRDSQCRRVLPGIYLAIARVTSTRTGEQAEYRTKIGVSAK